MLAALRERRAEILVRAVRDLWADCQVTLPALIERAAWPSLHFWLANVDGMRHELAPSLLAAGEAWAASGDPAPLAAAAAAGSAHWQALARRLLDLHRSKGAAADGEIAAMTHDIRVIAL
jgi:hypothetical protein